MIQSQPMLARRMLRLAAVTALQEAKLAVNGVSVDIESPGDWSQASENLPVVYVQTSSETKTAVMGGMSEFNSTCSLLIKATVQSSTAESAQDDVEALWYQIENAILSNYSVVGMSQKIPSVNSILEIKADGSQHLAGIAGSFDVECFESYNTMNQYITPTKEPSDNQVPSNIPWPTNPPDPASITGANITLDAINVYDPTGSYPSAPFPNSVNPTPRESGPDGRSEGSLDIPLQGA